MRNAAKAVLEGGAVHKEDESEEEEIE